MKRWTTIATLMTIFAVLSAAAWAADEKAPKKEETPKKEEAPKKGKKDKKEAGAWGISYKAAVAQAKKEKKLILVDFTGSDWCGWCIKLKKEVFDTDEFKKWAKDNVVLLEIDFPRDKSKLTAATQKQNEELKNTYKITGFPTILFLDADGKQQGKSGYMAGGPEAWTKNAQQIVDKYKKESGDKVAKN